MAKSMPETPDIEAYIEALNRRVLGEPICGIRIASPFVLRTVAPLPPTAVGRVVTRIVRLGKRIVFEFEPFPAGADPGEAGTPENGPLFMVIHLMIAGRLHWKNAGAPIPKGSGLAAFDFLGGTLILTEAGSKKRASLHFLLGREALDELDPGGLEPVGSSRKDFAAALARENHTLKRALTDPHLFSGIGNAYSDEILHRAHLSPLKKTKDLSAEEVSALHAATVEVLTEWTERLRAAARETFPEKVTAFRPEMAVHGRYGASCPVCGAKVERIVYAKNECNYCPDCQTGGRLLADRALSRLLKDDWPRSRSD
jgi:formamidopyrimidine-DNA glycosylase